MSDEKIQGLHAMSPEEYRATFGSGVGYMEDQYTVRHVGIEFKHRFTDPAADRINDELEQIAKVAREITLAQYCCEPPHPANVEASLAIDGPTFPGQKLMTMDEYRSQMAQVTYIPALPADLDAQLREILYEFAHRCLVHAQGGLTADQAIQRIKALFGVTE